MLGTGIDPYTTVYIGPISEIPSHNYIAFNLGCPYTENKLYNNNCIAIILD
jgi:hypothetical protein